MFIKSSGICVYSHKAAGVLIYIGKGVCSRPFERTRRNEKWNELVVQAGGFEVEILGWFDSDGDARKFEARAIRELAPVCNLVMNGWKRSDEFKRIISRTHKGKIVSAETRKRMSAASQLGKLRCKRIVDTETGLEYESIVAASRALNIPKATFRAYFAGRAKHVHGKTFMVVPDPRHRLNSVSVGANHADILPHGKTL
jgi:hypothetical protein